MSVNLSQQMKELLEGYTDEIMHSVVDILEDVAEESANKLKQDSTGAFKNRSGRYRKGWTSTTEKKNSYTSAIVHNKKSYRLTHLLEFGHAKVNGGRTRAFEHIGTVNADAQEEAYRRIIEMIKETK